MTSKLTYKLSLLPLAISLIINNTTLTAAESSADGEEKSQDAVITITGTRLKDSGYEAPTPVIVLGDDDMQARGTTNVADLINEVPSFTRSLTPQSTILNSRQSGVNGLDLRGLGANRTLVLVNGRRHIPFDEFNTIDVNAIPSVAIEKVEIVTGGASAAWGSDAVSGVVNIIYDQDMDGGKFQAQYGESAQGDAENVRVSGANGGYFSNEKGHYMVAFEHYNNDGVLEGKSRGWARKHPGLLVNPMDTGPSDGIPQYLFANDAALFIGSPNGVTLPLGLPTDNLEFLPNGTAITRNLGIIGGNLMQGGSGSFLSDRNNLDIPVERQSLLGTISYEISDRIEFFAEANYTQSKTSGALVDAFTFGEAIFSGNPYLPTSVQQTMDDSGVPFLVLFRTFEEFPPITSENENKNQRLVFGLDGKFDNDWWWEAYYQYGKTKFTNNQANNLLPGNLSLAADAVVDPVSGQTVCAANAGGANGAPGCVPINLFGFGSPNQAAIDYITATGMALTVLEQKVASYSLGGDLFSGWAGPITSAFGVEFRDESLDRTVDENNDNENFLITNAQPLNGDIDVKEVFSEFLVPLIDDDQKLNFNAAIRWADYSTVGSTVSWKGGLVYNPTESLMFRGSISQDIRAPSIGENFLETLLLFGNVTNPNTGNEEFIQILNTGNSDLKQEKSLNSTVGIVWSPTNNELQVSLDWYNIDLEDGIGSIDTQEIINRCSAGASEYCSLIVYNSDGSIANVTNKLLNLGTFELEGIDFAANYKVPVGSGQLGLSFIGSYLIKKEVAPQGAEPLDVAGEVGTDNVYGSPELKVNLKATYDQGPWGIFAQLRYIGSGKYNITYGPEQLSASDNNIGAQTYLDLSAYYKFETGSLDNLEIYAGINNALDRDPPVAPLDFISNVATNAVLYDVIGRSYYAGIRLVY